MNRARVVTLNAALGPLDYRVPEGMHVEPGTVLVAPLGPRQLIGVAWEPERLPTEEVGDNRLRPIIGTLAVPPIADSAAPARGMDGRLLPRTARLGAADDSPVVERAGRAEAAHGISAHRDGAGPHDTAAHESACLARRPPGHGARARGPCRRQRRSDAGAAQRGRSRSRGGRGGPGPSRPQSRPRPARSQSGAAWKLRRACRRPSARASIPSCSTA